MDPPMQRLSASADPRLDSAAGCVPPSLIADLKQPVRAWLRTWQILASRSPSSTASGASSVISGGIPTGARTHVQL